jgi:hypothetical protein
MRAFGINVCHKDEGEGDEDECEEDENEDEAACEWAKETIAWFTTCVHYFSLIVCTDILLGKFLVINQRLNLSFRTVVPPLKHSWQNERHKNWQGRPLLGLHKMVGKLHHPLALVELPTTTTPGKRSHHRVDLACVIPMVRAIATTQMRARRNLKQRTRRSSESANP